MRTDDATTVGIFADDLTSAADGAVPFIGWGLQASISRGRMPQLTFPVTAVDGGMRSLPAAQAGARAAALASQLASRKIFYKTVDSTLRGHVLLELEAAFKVSNRKTLVFAPAFPAAGRTTIEGVQFVDGIPVDQSLYGRDPVHPACTSVLADLVPDVRAEVIILDAVTQEELDDRVASVPDPQTVFWAGSPGMASALARCIGARSTPVAIDAVTRKILVAIGTANPRSHDQGAEIEGMPDVTVLRSPRRREADPAALLDRIAEDAAVRLSRGEIAALIATGGETMEAILGRLGIDEFEILRELEPGFPLGRVCGQHGRGLLIAMKAGGFGDQHTLHRAIAQLRRAGPSSDQERP